MAAPFALRPLPIANTVTSAQKAPLATPIMKVPVRPTGAIFRRRSGRKLDDGDRRRLGEVVSATGTTASETRMEAAANSSKFWIGARSTISWPEVVIRS